MKLTDAASLCVDEATANDFLRHHGIIRADPPVCQMEHCTRTMTCVKTGRSDNVIWRSHKSYKVSIRKGSFLEDHKLSSKDFILLLYLWSHEISVTSASELVGVCIQTSVQWYSYFRDICSHHLVTHPIQIGGPGVIVQIDESVMTRRKYDQGRLVPERWVFGGIDSSSKIGFLCFADNRSSNTLIPPIQRHIVSGSIIHSDQWSAYGHLLNLPYTHVTVNHSQNFVDPDPGAHTNNIENMWRNAKRKFKGMLGVHSTMLPGHLDEFMWRQRFGKTHDEAFYNALLHLSEWYVLQLKKYRLSLDKCIF